MNNLARFVICMFSVVIALWSNTERARAGTVLIGATDGGVIYDIDTATGLASNPRDTGLAWLSGIALAPSGGLYGWGESTQTDPLQLYTIDLATGSVTPIGNTSQGYFVRDLATNPTNFDLHAVYSVPGTGGEGIARVNRQTGQLTPYGGVPDHPGSLAFGIGGEFYVLAWDNLFTVNPDTGELLSTLPLPESFPGYTLAPAPDGALFSTGLIAPNTQGLFALDPVTGEALAIGPTGLGVAGISSLAVVPEPTTALLLLSGISVILRRK